MSATEKMKDALKRSVEEVFGIKTEFIKKNINNGGQENQLMIIEETGVNKCIYIDDIIQKLENGEITMLQVLINFEQIINHKSPTVNVTECLKKENILKNVVYAMINHEMNKEYLEKVPHKIWNDLAVIYKVNVSMGNLSGKIVLDNCKVEMEGLSLEEIDEAAKKNTLDCGFKIHPISRATEILKNRNKEFSDEEESDSMFIATNYKIHDGASILLYPELMHSVAEKNKSDLLIAPSSIHDVIFYTDAANLSVNELKEVVRGVNETIVMPSEFLSNSVYRYSRETGQITKVA